MLSEYCIDFGGDIIKKTGVICPHCGQKTDSSPCHNCGKYIEEYTEEKKPDFKAAYNILMDYWDYLPDEDKPEIDKRLKEVGL